MGAIAQIRDRMVNIMSGQGTAIDRRTAASYVFNLIGDEQAEAAYRSSWLVRKIIDIPAIDMTRKWRDWQAEGADIETIENEEKRLGLKAKVRRALILSRLYGGGVIVMGTGDSDPMKPLDPEKVKAEGLKYLQVLAPRQLSIGAERLDPEDEWVGKPEWFEIQTGHLSHQRVKMHPSRVVEFIGQRAPEGGIYSNGGWFWGDSIMQSISNAVKNADLAQDGFAALIDRAQIDILRMPGFTELAQTTEGEQRALNRLSVTKLGQSTWRTTLLDSEDEWDQRQVTWAGMTDIISSYLLAVSGAADIPVTRLLGQSPSGLASTGDGEERDYHAMIAARQDEMMCPAFDRIDELLIRSATGARDPDIYYEFPPLGGLSEKDAAAVDKQIADTIDTIAKTGLIHEEALAEIQRNRMIEDGRWPGCESAFDKVKEALGSKSETPEEKAARIESEQQSAEQLAKAQGPVVVPVAGKPVAKPAAGVNFAAKAKLKKAVNDAQAALDAFDEADYNPNHVPGGQHGGEFSPKGAGGAAAELAGELDELSDLEKEALEDYKNGNYKRFNDPLRKGTKLDAKTAKQIAHIDRALSRASLAKSQTVYRGIVSREISGNAASFKGKIIEDRAFMSTSSNIASATGTTSNSITASKPGSVLFELKARKGAKALPIDALGKAAKNTHREGELLFARGSRIRIDGVSSKTWRGYTIVQGTIL